MIDGVIVTIEGKDWTVPPLNFKSLKKYGPELSAKTPQQLVEEGKVIELIHAAMIRNYPDLTIEQVEDMVDLGNVMEITMAVLGVSGLVAKQPGGAPAASPLTGESSTGS